MRRSLRNLTRFFDYYGDKNMLKVGFIGLGNVGGKLAGSLIRNGFDTTVRDLNKQVAQEFLDLGASWANSPKEMAEKCDLIITCLPSPRACALVMEAEDGTITSYALMRSCSPSRPS